jgi:transcriptional regulator with XRE-family HTH domain
MNNIRIARMSRGLQQKDITEKLGLSSGVVSRWERGISRPDSRAIVELSRILDYTADYLMGDADDSGAPAPQFAPKSATPPAVAAMSALMQSLPEDQQLALVSKMASELQAMRAG